MTASLPEHHKQPDGVVAFASILGLVERGGIPRRLIGIGIGIRNTPTA